MTTNPLDALYLSGIELIAEVIGYDAAFKSLLKEFQARSDEVKSQMFSLDGALMNDVATIVKEYPGKSVRFMQNDGRLGFEISGARTQEEAEEIRRRIDAAIKSRNKLPGIPEVEGSFTSTIRAEDVIDEE